MPDGLTAELSPNHRTCYAPAGVTVSSRRTLASDAGATRLSRLLRRTRQAATACSATAFPMCPSRSCR
eukprot:4282139-Pyramimonas_sp.AAC.1